MKRPKESTVMVYAGIVFIALSYYPNSSNVAFVSGLLLYLYGLVLVWGERR